MVTDSVERRETNLLTLPQRADGDVGVGGAAGAQRLKPLSGAQQRGRQIFSQIVRTKHALVGSYREEEANKTTAPQAARRLQKEKTPSARSSSQTKQQNSPGVPLFPTFVPLAAGW